MKKLVYLLVVLSLVSILIAGCSASTTSAPAATSSPAAAPKTTPSPVATTPAAAPAPAPASTTTSPAAQKIYKLRLQAFMPPADDLYSKYISTSLVSMVKEATNGQVEITTFPNGALVPPTEIFKSTASGIVDIGYTAASYQMGFIPVSAVLDGLPMSFRNYKDLLTLYREKGLGDIISQEYEKNGVHLLTIHCTEAYTVLSTKPLTNKDSFKGTKIRGWGIWNKYFGNLGASAVDMPLAEVYMALSLKTVDGVLTGINPHFQLKHYESCKYGLWPGLNGSSAHDIYMNNNTWKSLPDNLKVSLTKAFAAWTDDTAEKWYQFSLTNKENLASKGVKWADVDDRAWLTESAMGLWAETAAKDAASAKAVKIMTDYLKAEGAIK